MRILFVSRAVLLLALQPVLRSRHILSSAFSRLTAPCSDDVRQTRSIPGPPAVTIPRITVVARSGVRSIEILVAVNPARHGPSHIRSIAVSRLVADDLRGRDQRIRRRLNMTQKRRRIGTCSNQQGRPPARTHRSFACSSSSARLLAASKIQRLEYQKTDGAPPANTGCLIQLSCLTRMLTRAFHAYFSTIIRGLRGNLNSRVQRRCRQQPTFTSRYQASGKSGPSAENREPVEPVAGHICYTGCRMPA